MTTFQSVNVGLGPHDHQHEVTTPTTPRAPIILPSQSQSISTVDEQSTATPTRLNFGGISGQRPLPTSPFRSSFTAQTQVNEISAAPGALKREQSHRSVQSTGSQDVDMDESDEEGGSDEESIDAETGRPSKKKKGQKFFCTEFPPCNLSFTRSEHLARHIRKHTGERPFQCHCSRRFSRLDNLRQHAQTVHVNEEIPGDSLAATGTRFQRQIRTDRVRTPTGRSRASTASSQGSHGRGHSRNLSASSVGSTASTISRGDDNRRRPPPLMMASSSDPNARSRPSVDPIKTQPSSPPPQYGFSKESSEGLSTPTSTTFSNGASSPGYGSSFGSPVSTVSRQGSFWGGTSYHGRRLSVPSGPNPFQSPQGSSYPTPYLSPLAPSNSSLNSSNSSLYGSPVNSTYPFDRRETPEQAEWRRRTWHPTTYNSYTRPATSGLSFYQTPDDAPRPAFAPQAAAIPAASLSRRLPGIEAFDQMSNRPPSPTRPGGSPMQVDPPSKPPIYPGPAVPSNSGPNDRRGHASWDMSLHQNLTRLDIASGTPPKETTSWGQQALAEIRNAGLNHPETHPQQGNTPPQENQAVIHQETQKRPAEPSLASSATPIQAKRRGWYNGPLAAPKTFVQRTSPEGSSSSDSVPTPSFSTADYHPSIVHSDGSIESNQVANQNNYRPTIYEHPSDLKSSSASHQQAPQESNLTSLEVLVAVATSENKAPAAQPR